MDTKIWIAPKWWKPAVREPNPQTAVTAGLTGDELRRAVAFALVDVMKNGPVKIEHAARVVAGKIGAPLTHSEWCEIISKLADDWAHGRGPNVPAYEGSGNDN